MSSGVPKTIGPSPSFSANEVANQTRTQLRNLAIRKGLVPKGDATQAEYPRKWDDPATGRPRLRLGRGHVDPTTGQPYSNPNAAADHVHAYDASGAKIFVNGDNHIPTTGE